MELSIGFSGIRNEYVTLLVLKDKGMGYAVFEQQPQGFWQQTSKWYQYRACAVKAMCKQGLKKGGTI